MSAKPTYEELERRVKKLEKVEAERKWAEKALKAEKEFAFSIIDNAPTFFVAIDAQGKTMMMNQLMLDFLGYAADEVVGKNYLSNFVPEKDRDILADVFRKLTAEHEHTLNENHILSKDGKEFLVEWHGTPVFDTSEEFQYFYGIGINITERKRSENAILASEEKYRLLFENTGTATFVVEEDMTVAKSNAKCEELSGYSRDEIEGKMKTTDFIPVEEFERIKEYHAGRREIEGQIPSEYEFKFSDKYGNLKNVFIQVSMIPGTKQSVASIIDITPLKAAEKALRESKEKYRELANSLPQVVFEMDANGLITFVNRNAFDFYGYTQDDFDKGVTALQMLIPEDRDRAMKNMQRRLQGEALGRREYTALRKDGGTFPVVVHVTPAIRDNKPIGLRGIMIDITERKQAEEEKRKLEAQLLHSQKMEAIGTLAGGIAHDFNNILSAIIGYTELVLSDIEIGSLLHNYLQRVLIAGQRAKNLVNQILTFSRQTEQELKPVQVKLIAREVIKLLRASLPATIEIKQNLRSNDTVMADPTQINQVLMNLCVNAGYAMRAKGGVLDVSLVKVELDSDYTDNHPDLKPGPYLKLTVSDTGHGMPPEVQERIFDPFFTTKEKEEGTGMGLAVVHGIVKSHGGTLAVYSEPEKGSVFNVFLPIIEERLELETSLDKPIPQGTECILFIDDEGSLVDVGQRILESLGYDVVTRTSGIEALALFKAQPDRFDLVITDLTMPKMTGDELAVELLRIKPGMPIILCTGFSAMIDEDKVKAMGMRAFVFKPILKRDLAETIRKVLDGN